MLPENHCQCRNSNKEKAPNNMGNGMCQSRTFLLIYMTEELHQKSGGHQSPEQVFLLFLLLRCGLALWVRRLNLRIPARRIISTSHIVIWGRLPKVALKFPARSTNEIVRYSA